MKKLVLRDSGKDPRVQNKEKYDEVASFVSQNDKVLTIITEKGIGTHYSSIRALSQSGEGIVLNIAADNAEHALSELEKDTVGIKTAVVAVDSSYSKEEHDLFIKEVGGLDFEKVVVVYPVEKNDKGVIDV